MRTSGEIMNEYMNTRITPSELIRIVQIETWNEAIQAAADNAEATFETLDETHSIPFVDMKSILKLKKDNGNKNL